MIFEHHIPAPPLGLFVESYIYYKGYEPDYSFDRFLPDGHINVVFDLTETPKSIYDNDSLKEIQSCRRVWFSGIREESITIPSGKDSEMLIINFHLGKAYPFVEMPMHELKDAVVDGEMVLSPDILNLRDGLLHCSTASEKFDYLTRGLYRLFKHKLIQNPFTDYAVSFLQSHSKNAAISLLAEKVGYSQKHMISMFKNNVGLSPKAFLKVMRFQKVIAGIGHDFNRDWIGLASDTGYYDQSHFIHEFKKYAGFTPAAYAESRKEFANYVAVG